MNGDKVALFNEWYWRFIDNIVEKDECIAEV